MTPSIADPLSVAIEKAYRLGMHAGMGRAAAIARDEADRIKHDAGFFGLGDLRLEKVALDIAKLILEQANK